MQVLTYGYKQPENGDRGSVFFPALNFDIQRLNDHNHDGTNSSKLTGASIIGLSSTISSAGWVAVSGQPGTYSQDVAMPAGTLFDDYIPYFRVTTAGANFGKILNLTLTRVDASIYTVFINDNTLSLAVLYLI